MERNLKKDDLMDTERPEPPPLPSDDDDDDDDEEKREARRKLKGKARAYPLGEEEENGDNDEQRLIESPRATRPNPLAFLSTAAEDTSMDMDMDDYWAGYEMRFGDADAAINETISSPSTPSSSYNYEAENENDLLTTPIGRKPLSERHDLTKHDQSRPADTFAAQQQHQMSGGLGRGRGRGRGQGWGLEWQETVTQEKMRQSGLVAYDEPHPSPVDEETGWEEYDESVWEKATVEVKKVTLKVPSVTRGEGSRNAASDSSRVAGEQSERQSGEFVRAMTDYKAILPGNFLTYEKDDVMKVKWRDSDGRSMVLIWTIRDTTSLTCGRETLHPLASQKHNTFRSSTYEELRIYQLCG